MVEVVLDAIFDSEVKTTNPPRTAVQTNILLITLFFKLIPPIHLYLIPLNYK